MLTIFFLVPSIRMQGSFSTISNACTITSRCLSLLTWKPTSKSCGARTKPGRKLSSSSITILRLSLLLMFYAQSSLAIAILSVLRAMCHPEQILLPYPKLPACCSLPSQRSGMNSEDLSKSVLSLRIATKIGIIKSRWKSRWESRPANLLFDQICDSENDSDENDGEDCHSSCTWKGNLNKAVFQLHGGLHMVVHAQEHCRGMHAFSSHFAVQILVAYEYRAQVGSA